MTALVRLGAWLRTRSARRSLGTAMAIVTAVLFVQLLTKSARPSGTDLTSYLLSASHLAHGLDPYTTGTVFPYIYPLFLAFVLIPLTALPHQVAHILWFAASLGALWMSARVLVDANAAAIIGVPAPQLWASLALLALFLLDPIQINLLNGQVNLIVLLLLALFLRAHVNGRSLLAAMCLGGAIAIKIVPAALLVFLLARRAVGTLVGAIGIAAVLCLLPYLCTGDRLWTYYDHYVRFILARTSIPAVAGRDIIFSVSGIADALQLGISPAWTKVLGSVVTLGPVFWIGSRPETPPLWTFSLIVIAIPLLTPISEVHHLAFMFPAAALTTLVALHRAGQPDRVGWVLVGAGWLLFWIGRLDRPGPYYALSLAAFYVATLRQARRVAPAGGALPCASTPDMIPS
jgi:hypothetical protein